MRTTCHVVQQRVILSDVFADIILLMHVPGTENLENML